MKQTTIVIILGFVFGTFSYGQKIPLPQNYAIIDTVSGDLDKDGIKEMVVAYDTQIPTKDSSDDIPRELVIYKKTSDTWVVWQKSNQALLGSEDGGMMGDPFNEIKIENGLLHISQSGGSSWKWGYTDKYRYQNGEFYLIGYTSSGGKPCEYWQSVDFNLITGKIIVTKHYEDCGEAYNETPKITKREDETLFQKGIKITLINRGAGGIKIVTPKYGHEIYIE